MIKVEKHTVVLKCDCHSNGYEVVMARVADKRLTIISKSHGNTHIISVGLDKLQRMYNDACNVIETNGTAI